MDKVAKCNAQNAQATICLLFIALQQCWCAPNASTAILWGRVVSRQDDPIASAKVCVWLLKPVHGQSAILAETHTDGKGRYRLSNLPAGVKLGVAFSAPMFATELMQVTLKGGEVRRLDAMLFRPSSITGSIIDRHTGDVFAGLEVRIVAVRVIKPEEGMDALPNIYKCTQVTDAEGRYHLSGMRPGEYVVQITSPLICTGAMDPWNTGFPKHTAAIRIQVKEGKEMTGADIIVERPGQLLLHVAPQERIAILREYWDSLRLRIESVEFDSVAATIATLRDGRVCVPVRSGLRRLMVWMLNAPVLEDVVRFLPGEVIERRISLPPIALIEGRVLDKHGKPVPNARVRVISTLSAPSDAPVHEAVRAPLFAYTTTFMMAHDKAGMVSVQTDAKGNYKVALLSTQEPVYVIATAPGYTMMGTAPLVSLKPSGKVNVTLHMRRVPVGSISGRLTLSDGRPLPRGTPIRVEIFEVAWAQPGQEPLSVGFGAQAKNKNHAVINAAVAGFIQVGEDGRYRIDNVIARDYLLRISGVGYVPPSKPRSVRVLDGIEVTNVDFEMQPPVNVTLRLVDANTGAPVSNPTVWVLYTNRLNAWLPQVLEQARTWTDIGVKPGWLSGRAGSIPFCVYGPMAIRTGMLKFSMPDSNGLSVVAFADGYSPATKVLQTSKDKRDISVTLTMHSIKAVTGALRIYITDMQSNPVSDTTVALRLISNVGILNMHSEKVTTSTDAQGRVFIEHIGAGAYTLLLELPGYKRGVVPSILIRPNEITDVTVKLQRKY